MAWNAQLDLDLGAASSMEVVCWVETEEKREKLKQWTTKAAEEVFSGGEHLAQFEFQVEAWPSRAGRRDREEGWAGKSVESWR